MPKEQQQQGSLVQDMKNSFNLSLWLINSLCLCFFVFIRSGMGTRALGWEGLIVFGSLPMLAALLHSNAMLLFWKAWIVMALFRMLTADRNQHTRYPGWPWVMSILTLGLLGESKLRFLEPFMLLGVAYLISDVSMPAAKAIAFGGIAIGINNRIGMALRRKIRDDIRDAAHDAANYYR